MKIRFGFGGVWGIFIVVYLRGNENRFDVFGRNLVIGSRSFENV